MTEGLKKILELFFETKEQTLLNACAKRDCAFNHDSVCRFRKIALGKDAKCIDYEKR